MPYIDQKLRDEIDPAIDELIAAISQTEARCHGSLEGMLNYAMTRILVIEHSDYRSIVRILGTLEAVKLEYYRRMAAPYEDYRRDRGGEVY